MKKYIGNELELFKDAINWKKYFALFILPRIRKKVIEIGAGLGGTTNFLFRNDVVSWLCVEPDPDLVSIINDKIAKGGMPSVCKTYNGFSCDIQGCYDTIIYIDVIEHINNVPEELMEASRLLEPGGYLIILVPAFQFLYSPFDKQVGHFRRYTKKTLQEVVPIQFKIESLRYLDSCGFLASVVNKILLKQNLPTKGQVKFWDRFLIPLSKVFDFFFSYLFGKSLLLVAKKK